MQTVSETAQRRTDAAAWEWYGEQLMKAGRDLAIFGLLVAAYAFFGNPEVSHRALLFMQLAGAGGCVLYVLCLVGGTYMHCKALALTRDLPSAE